MPARNRLRIIAQQNADGVFVRVDLPLQVRDLRIRGIEDWLRLQNVELGGNPVVQAKIGQLHRSFLRRHSVACDLQLQVKLQQREIITGNVADQRQNDRLPRILGCKQLRAGRFRRATQLAEEVQLEGGVGRQSQKIKFGLKIRFFSTAERAVSLGLRDLPGTSHAKFPPSSITSLLINL